MTNSEDESNEDEFLYEFLEKRPTVKIFYSFFVIFACIFGLIANSLIIYMKLRKFKNRNPFDLMTANVAIGLNFLAIRFIMIMIEETTHDFISLPLCYTARLSVDFGTTIVVFSIMCLMILIKYQPNLNKNIELKIIILIWIFSAIIALPIYNLKVIEFTSWKKSHRICIMSFNDDRNHRKYFTRLWISVIVKIFAPLATVIVFFISLRFNFTIGQNRKLWFYSIIMSIYYFIFSLMSVISPLLNYYLDIEFGSRFMVYVSFNFFCFIVSLNPLVLWFLDRDLYEETTDYLRYKLRRETNSNSKFNEIVFNEKDFQSVDIE